MDHARSDLRRRTLFAFYTSKVGPTMPLGLTDRVRVERFHSCHHKSGGSQV